MLAGDSHAAAIVDIPKTGRDCYVRARVARVFQRKSVSFTMELDPEKAEVAANYLSTLSDLTTNSKLTINVLTMLAEESKDHGQIIVDTITQHIAKVLIYLYLYIIPITSSFDRYNKQSTGAHQVKVRESERETAHIQTVSFIFL